MQQVQKPLHDYSIGDFGLFVDLNGKYYIIYRNKHTNYEVLNNTGVGNSVFKKSGTRELEASRGTLSILVRKGVDYRPLEFKYNKVFPKPEYIFSDLHHLNLTSVLFEDNPYRNIEEATVITTNQALLEYHKRKGDTYGIITLKDPHNPDNDTAVSGILYKKASGALGFAHNHPSFNGSVSDRDGYKLCWTLTGSEDVWWADFRPSQTIESKAIRGNSSTLAEEEERYKPIRTTSKESDFQNPVIISTKQTKNKLL